MSLKPHMVTLGVRDLEAALAFYKDGMGLTPSPSSDNDIVFFSLGTIILGLFPWEKLAEDAFVSANGEGFQGITLSYNVKSGKEVAEVIERARRAGAKVVKQPQKAVWGGISGYFQDPDGHLWEVAYNPFWQFDKDGNIELL